MLPLSSLPPAAQAKILNGPALTPPLGIESNFDHPPNNDLAIHIPFAIFVALVTVAVFGRIYIRFFHLKQPFIGDCAFVHQWDVRLKDLPPFLHFTFISSILYSFVVAPVKVAILLEWLRIFSPAGIRNLVYWTSHFLIWAIVIFYMSTVVVLNVACTPYEYTWNRLIAGSCKRANTKDADLAVSVFNVISDVMILLIPQHAIWKLQLAPKKKLGISFIFAIGLFGCAAAIARLVETVKHATSDDFTYTFSSVMLCSGVEMCCAFLVICVPSFPKAFQAVNISKWKQSLSFWTSGNSQRQLRSSSKKSGEDGSWPRYQSSRFPKKRPSGSTDSSDEHQLYPVPKPPYNESSELSLHAYDLEYGVPHSANLE
ncbi:hypothetical protein LSUE1_G001012 [Lachnellula suecica]|uniref:Rhodopsin domain-containing protein n=1 Tax=Lachnellula suecica TaxID=602035 RepID=A0A8T9CEG4_9HELO|nr:hypothetical protein LSUE1_G001012 [Lachnellula suecica]